MTPYKALHWDDPAFAARGREIVRCLLHLLVKRNRLLLCWLETEWCRVANERQLNVMTTENSLTGSRLAPLLLDVVTESTSFSKPSTVIAPEFEDDDSQLTHEEGELHRMKNLWDDIPAFFGLAVGEVDDKILSGMDFNSFSSILRAVSPGYLDKLSLALKVGCWFRELSQP
ncbi:hypothetical protein M427DRAFT_52091 [Gonapodya prolifera JEL478]|uniref:Uncharacterized protein n=1 Tax=Gonapodya prolifera (strain JEL478) TaxID=1344416 RepID=A0A139AUS2_GONPJ|nr:hypothetical protein M427DRAFT_52091 [Gonapodya prolifera JEL478]|eukprot:KXS20481.1 hypothetical protein M427DRAFT_52091 [Gonapodya prolifera JEL478]